MDVDELMNLADRVEQLAPADATWVQSLLNPRSTYGNRRNRAPY